MGLLDIFGKPNEPVDVSPKALAELASIQHQLQLAEGDPQARETGTSYTAKGSEPVPKNALNELGSQRISGLRETVPELSGRQARLTYDKMANSDVAVDISLRAAKTGVLGATFYFQPYGDEEKYRDQAEFAKDNLLRKGRSPFLLILEEILRFYEYGHSVLEPVYELREWAPSRVRANRRKYTMLRKLAPRPAASIKEFLYDDDGGPVGIKHLALRADGKTDEVEIPIEKLVIFTLNKKGGNLEGRSLLRTAYPHWYYKKHLYNIDAIQKERHALGVPEIDLPPGYNSKDVQAAWELVKNIRTNENAGIVKPPGYNIGFAKVEGQLVDVMKSIEHHNAMIMLNVMIQFLLQGMTEAGGARAAAASHQNMYEKSLRYIANFVCEVINLYLIPWLIGYNFDTDEFPQLKVRNIGEARDFQAWAAAMANLASEDLITMDTDTENWVREQADMPGKLGEWTPRESESRRGGVQPGRRGAGGGNTPKGADEA